MFFSFAFYCGSVRSVQPLMICIIVIADTEGVCWGWRMASGGQGRTREVRWALSTWDIGGHVKSHGSNNRVFSRDNIRILYYFFPVLMGLTYNMVLV